MPKKVLFHSFIHHLLSALRDVVEDENSLSRRESMNDFIDSLSIENLGAGKIKVSSSFLKSQEMIFSTDLGCYFTRGDTIKFTNKQIEQGQLFNVDKTLISNNNNFKETAKKLFSDAIFK